MILMDRLLLMMDRLLMDRLLMDRLLMDRLLMMDGDDKDAVLSVLRSFVCLFVCSLARHYVDSPPRALARQLPAMSQPRDQHQTVVVIQQGHQDGVAAVFWLGCCLGLWYGDDERCVHAITIATVIHTLLQRFASMLRRSLVHRYPVVHHRWSLRHRAVHRPYLLETRTRIAPCAFVSTRSKILRSLPAHCLLD